LGLVIGSLLLQLFSAAPAAGPLPQAVESGATVADEAALQEAASRFGYRLLKDGEKVYTAEEVERIREQLRQETNDASAANVQEKRSFVITPGMSSEKVGEILAGLELIENEEQFMQLMNERKLHKKIRTGTYTFSGNPSADEIIERITTPPEE
jgi:cell division protein YceG involved in septum cleavage